VTCDVHFRQQIVAAGGDALATGNGAWNERRAVDPSFCGTSIDHP
jgi:hypothetical protein